MALLLLTLFVKVPVNESDIRLTIQYRQEMYGLNTQNNNHPRDVNPDIQSLQVRGTARVKMLSLFDSLQDIDCAAWPAHDEKRCRD